VGSLVMLLKMAGVVQIVIAFANFALPGKLKYRDNLERVSPIIRQIFIVHSGYIVGVLLLFATISLRFARELASGRGLGSFLAVAIAVFWLARVPLQLFYYDATVRRTNRAGDVAFTAATMFLALIYTAAAIAPRL